MKTINLISAFLLFFVYYWCCLGAFILLLAGIPMGLVALFTYGSGWEMAGLPDWMRLLGLGWLTLAALWMAQGELRKMQAQDFESNR